MGGVAASTLKRYSTARDKHVCFCHKQELRTWNQIDKAAVQAYGGWLHTNQYADASIYFECTPVKQVINMLIDVARVLPESNRVRLSLRRSQETTTYSYTRAQVSAMLKHCQESTRLDWLANIIVGLATTGMRSGEMMALRWSSVDLDNGIIHITDNRHSASAKKMDAVRTTKGRCSRRVPIHADLQKVLERISRREDGRVFSGPHGRVLKAATIRMALLRYVVKPLKKVFATPSGEIGFADGRVHSFRHYFVSQSFVGSASEGEIREWVGHRDSKIVERYRHLSQEDARRKMDRLHFLDKAPATEAIAQEPNPQALSTAAKAEAS